MKKIRVINVIIIIFFLLTSNSFSKINNSVIISVGNLPITYLDLVKEMRLIALMSNNKIDDSNKEQFKNIAVQALIKRKIKEIEIKKFKVENYSTKDLDNLILKTSKNIGTDKKGLQQLMKQRNLDLDKLKSQFVIDLKWNTLIFELYKNKISLNMDEIEEKINIEVNKNKSNKKFLLSEIEIQSSEDKQQESINKILESIKKDGFENTAKKFSISESAKYGGNIGWIEEAKLSGSLYKNIKNLKVDQVSEPIFVKNNIIWVKKKGEKVLENNVKKIKDNIVKIEKQKKLQMFSNAHYSKLERTIQIKFL
tara:strand:+ start:49 stop:978 length:930 start_codon:yes stop_codon:yes gene_type:complete